MTTLTAAQFVAMIESEDFSESLECVYDMAAEYNSEVAAFGDAGPGSGYRLSRILSELTKQKSTYERLTGGKFPYPLPAMRLPS